VQDPAQSGSAGRHSPSVDLAPRIAFALDAGLVTDCAAIECVGGDLLIKPVYGGKVMAAYTPAAGSS
jgi:electron transfer flavoprotein alpha subunit